MARRTPSTNVARSALDTVALVVRVILFVTLGVLVLLGVSEIPAVSAWLGRLGPDRALVSIVAGHWQSDSGAVCPDGLQEVELNLTVARRVARLLREQGHDVEVLPEYSPKLDGLQADVFLAVHMDSCVEELSGFKIVGVPRSAVPEEQDRLLAELETAYALATGLQPHPNTITEDMLEYHALRQISPSTPGAIIECGFMGGDRRLLTEEQDRVAVGIANGVAAYLREAPPSEATP